jgi:hypothetical protein
LDDLKKRISKDVEFLEITDEVTGFVAGGRRTYKKGGGCDFNISLTTMEEDLVEKSVNMAAALQFKMQIRTASQHFSDNIAFFDDQIKFIELSVKPSLLEFKGIRDSGTTSKTINQVINDGFFGEYVALFSRKQLKCVTSARDINQALCISYNTEKTNVGPVHFMYELDQAQPRSHFSVYMMPCASDA